MVLRIRLDHQILQTRVTREPRQSLDFGRVFRQKNYLRSDDTAAAITARQLGRGSQVLQRAIEVARAGLVDSRVGFRCACIDTGLDPGSMGNDSPGAVSGKQHRVGGQGHVDSGLRGMDYNFLQIAVQQRLPLPAIHDALDAEPSQLGEALLEQAGRKKFRAVFAVIQRAEGTAMIAGAGGRYFHVDRVDLLPFQPARHGFGVKDQLVAVDPVFVGVLHFMLLSGLDIQSALICLKTQILGSQAKPD